MKAATALAALCCTLLAISGAANDQTLPDPSTIINGAMTAEQHMQSKLQQAFEQHLGSAAGTSDAANSNSFITISTNNAIDDADKIFTAFFRSQEALTTSDATTEENIPGLAPTNAAEVKRAIPNLEHWSPLLTLMSPFLPLIHEFTNEIGFHLPFAWPLAAVGPTGDWLRTTMGSYWKAFWGEGPRPELAPSLLVANADAYKKLSQQIAAYSGLPPVPKILLNPFKANYVGWAVYDQLTRNMMLPRAPIMMEAVDGTLIKTEDGVELTLAVRPDGRYLVSNTTTLKILKEIHTGPPFPATIVIVDSFVVPKIRLMPRPPPPLLTQEEIEQLPEMMAMFKDAISQMPEAIADMPTAVNAMLEEQRAARRNDPSATPIMADIFRVNLTGPLSPVQPPETSVADLQVILNALLAKELAEQGGGNPSVPPASNRIKLGDIFTRRPIGRRMTH